MKASINEQLSISYQNLGERKSRANSNKLELYDSFSSEKSCKCTKDEFHRIISQDGDSDKDGEDYVDKNASNLILDRVLNEESLLELPLKKLISNFPKHTDGTNTD